MGTRLARWAWLPVTVALIALAIALRPDGGPAPAGAEEGTETPPPTATSTPDPSVDHDGDGCTAAQEAAMGFDDTKWYDFYDVPVPANPDPERNGSRNKSISMGDALAVFFYWGTMHNAGHNKNNVSYDSVKGSCDWNADTTPDEEGVCYDRTDSPDPSPPWDAGPPNGWVDFIYDVFTLLPQLGLDCGGIAGPAPTEGPNGMAIDADPSTESIDTAVTRLTGMPFQVGVNVTEAATAYQGYDLLLEYDDSKLAFVPTSDANWDTAPESWDHTNLGGVYWIGAAVSQVGDRLQGGAFTTLDPAPTATGQAVLATFECVAPGTTTLHLVTSDDNPAVFSSTLLPDGAPITTTLSDASVYCDDSTPTPSPTPTATPTATGGPTATATQTPVPDPCVGVCMTGFWEATYRNDPGNIVGHCNYDLTQSGASTVWGEISCTHASLGNVSGSLDQGTRSFDAVEEYQVPPLSVESHGTVTPEGDSDAGDWACIADCTDWGTYTSIRIGPHSEGEMPPVGDLTVSTALDDELTIPEGGLDPGTTVTVDFDTLPDAPPAGLVALSRAFVLGPEGASFDPPAELVIHYTVEDLGGTADPETLRVYVYNLVSGEWDLLGGTVDTDLMTLTVDLYHFSTFAVFGNPLVPPAVGGIAELPDIGRASSQEAGTPAGGSGWSPGAYAAVAGGLAAAVVAVTAGAWYARRRWLR